MTPINQFMTGFAAALAGLLYASIAVSQTLFEDRFQLRPGNIIQDCAECPTLVVVPAGIFTQGGSPSEPYSDKDEYPQRDVSVQTFAMGQSEVTFDQWDACVAAGGCSHVPDDRWGRGDQSVIRVSWHDAQQYVTWLRNATGNDYRLPSESEWEYAARAGTTTRFNTGDCITTVEANFDGHQPAEGCQTGELRWRTLPVSSFQPNDFGLYDMHGNVWEWVQDCRNHTYEGAPTDGSAWMSGDCHRAVIRGGSWLDSGYWQRSAVRYSLNRDYRSETTASGGFRVARTVTP